MAWRFTKVHAIFPHRSAVSILDWDVHHGNGVAAIFGQEPRVRYCSIHEAGGFPGTGQDESDRGALGNILNLPLPKGVGLGRVLRGAARQGVALSA